MAKPARPRDHPVGVMLAITDLIENRRYARVYARVVELEDPTVDAIAAGLDTSTTTVYADVNHLRDIGILHRVTDEQPYRYRAADIEMSVQTGDDSYRITPTLIVALARAGGNDNLQLYLDRHGVAGLASALAYAREYARGRVNARIVSREQDIPVLEAETIIQELRDVILDVEPDAVETIGTDALDRSVEAMDPE